VCETRTSTVHRHSHTTQRVAKEIPLTTTGVMHRTRWSAGGLVNPTQGAVYLGDLLLTRTVSGVHLVPRVQTLLQRPAISVCQTVQPDNTVMLQQNYVRIVPLGKFPTPLHKPFTFPDFAQEGPERAMEICGPTPTQTLDNTTSLHIALNKVFKVVLGCKT